MKKRNVEKILFKIGVHVILVVLTLGAAILGVAKFGCGDGYEIILGMFFSVLGFSATFGLTNAKIKFKLTFPVTIMIVTACAFLGYFIGTGFFEGEDIKDSVFGIIMYMIIYGLDSLIGILVGSLINFVVKLIIKAAKIDTKTNYTIEKQIAYKKYKKQLIQLISILVCFSILGCVILTIQKANWIIEDTKNVVKDKQLYFLNSMTNYCGYNCMNYQETTPYSENSLGVIPAFYLAHGDADEAPYISADVGFYSMLQNSKGETVANYQPCILFEKNVSDTTKHDVRVLILGDEFAEKFAEKYDKSHSSDSSISVDQAIYILSTCSLYGEESVNKNSGSVEIEGTCDDNLVYFENLTWVDCVFLDSFTYTPEKNQIDKGNMNFDDWFDYENGDCKISMHSLDFRESWNIEYNQKAKEACEQNFENPDNIVTCTLNMTDTIMDSYNGEESYAYSCAYVFHPLRMAIAELIYVYIAIMLFAIVAIIIMCIVMKKSYEKQQAAENNRRELTRGIAHELKTPLAITRGYVENWEYLPEEDKEEITHTMIGEMDHMNKMVTDLLELSHMEAGIKPLQWEDVDLYSLASSILKRMKNIIDERDLNVKVFPEDVENSDEFVVSADLEMIRVAMSNFISNAVKYAKKEVVITLTQSNKKVRFEIENDGSSIDNEEIKKVWDEFYKSDSVNRSTIGSSGLGLAITKNIFILHNAEYGCKSAGGKTAFSFEMSKKNKKDVSD